MDTGLHENLDNRYEIFGEKNSIALVLESFTCTSIHLLYPLFPESQGHGDLLEVYPSSLSGERQGSTLDRSVLPAQENIFFGFTAFLAMKKQISLFYIVTKINHIMPRVQHRCFNVCTHNRRMRQDLMASSLEELLAARMFVLSCCLLTLVLEEDGTVVDSEEFFQSLPNNTALMVLHRGEMFCCVFQVFPNCCQPTRSIIAKLAFDLYKLHPKDFLCSFGIEASLYEMYKLSYDFKCTKMKHILKQAGQLLIYSSSSLLQLIGEDDC
uniref:Cell death inducing DFFA like effector a n=1 Tax=Mastacembelus armatus TaxID=205130 RepID=A0A3Q3LF06_9TELE